MSTYWDVYCEDCGSDMGLHLNHGADECARVLAIVPRLIEAATAIRDAGTDLSIHCPYAGESRDIDSWIRVHGAHRLSVKSEYGERLGECRQYVACVSCGDRRPCTLPIGHEGDHVHPGTRSK